GTNGHTTEELSGTSFSAPMVASLVSLLLSVNPDLTHAQVYEALIRTADEVGGPFPAGQYLQTGHFGEEWDPYLGYGRINAYEAVRYVVEHFGGHLGGTSDTHPYRITAPLTLHDGADLTVRAGTTLDVRAEVLVEDGASLTVEPGVTLRFHPGVALVVEGTLVADSTLFTEAVPGQGWGGLRFDVDPMSLAPPPSALTGCTIEDAKGPTGVSGDAAVEVYGGTVTLSGTTIRDGTNVHGLWASGAGALVTLDEESHIENMTGNGKGVVAANGAEVRVYDSIIEENDDTGAVATGMGSRLYLYQSTVDQNGGYGVGSQVSGEVFFHKPGAPLPALGVTVSSSALGGLYAINSADMTAGLYAEDDPAYCVAACQNNILNNWQGPNDFDARSVNAAVLWAEYDFWGEGRTLNDLEIGTSSGGFLDVTPLWDGTSLRTTAPAARRGGPELPESVTALMDEAYRVRAQGDSAAATAALRAALPLALTSDERGLAYGASGRFLSHAAVPGLEAYLGTRTRPGDAARPWALAALLSAYAAQDRTAEAWAVARTLATEYAGSDHALAGLAMTVRLAAEAGDLASAEEALAGLREGWPALVETEAAEAIVWRLRGDGAGVRMDGPASAAATGNMTGFRLLGARPNPFRGRAVVPFEVPEAAQVRVSVYDVLGREVAVLADGRFEAGRYEATLDGAGLAAGLYLVRATVVAGDAESRYVSRVTVLR
ncbi:MAG TPA: S8 family serine peptidase, partial [Rubricoccaceae bacterium]|nr:S8 family serine peptidase [Rubricoccaceae bacterium]